MEKSVYMDNNATTYMKKEVFEPLGMKTALVDDVDLFIMYVNEEEKKYAAYLTQELRMAGFIVETEYTGRGLKGQFKQADRLNAKFLVILNSEDLVAGEIQVKDNQTKEVTMVKEAEIDDYLDMNCR